MPDPSPLDLHEELEKVCDAHSFRSFIEALCRDCPTPEEISAVTGADAYLNGINGWANLDLRGFFEAAHAGSEANNLGDDADSTTKAWQAAAQILYMGKIYE